MQFDNTNNEILLTEKEVSIQLQVSTKKLQKDRQTNRGIRYIKIGSSVRYKPSDVQKFIDQSTIHVVH